ncbi:MAG: POTRA domain-containing protein [Candidatus Omnitrophota bacterium]|jgi:hemolysin activation/secretion protein
MGKNGRFLVVLAVLLCANMPVFAEQAGDDQSDADLIDSMLSRQKVKEETLPVELMIKEKMDQERPQPALPAEAVLIKQINVSGVTAISKKEIEEIVSEFRNKELTGKDMQRCADQITDTYALKGFLTSYAYVDLSDLSQGVLEIKAFEGKVGEVKIEGNRYFSDTVYKNRIGLKKGDIFNFKLLKNNVSRTNRHFDRKVTPIVALSEAQGFTDITIKAKEKLPVHYIIDHDNYGSEYILTKRYKNTFVFNNVTGHDDSLNLKAQFCEADAQRLFDLDYFLPINNTWKWELYYMPFKRENYYYKDNEDNDFLKKAYKWYTYLYQTVVSEPNREFVMNYGFVQKFIEWYTGEEMQKYDKFCALLIGFDYVRVDDYGTTVISEDLEKGIPRMWGANTAEDSHSSVKGAGGKYWKQKIAVARRQKLFWDIDLLMKAQGQYSTQACTGVNVFSMGGYMGTIDNRGYPRAQLPMDSGYYLLGGFSLPAYFIPKNTKLPLTHTDVYKNLKLLTYVEYAKGYKRSPQSEADKSGSVDPALTSLQDDDKRKSLSSVGWGWTFAVPEQDLSMRFDMAWPLDHKLPKDGSHCHMWYRVTKIF